MSQGALLGARQLRALLDAHGVVPKKSLGQNFVIDPNTILKVVSCAGLTGEERVIEIGAGAGSLTVALAHAAAHVTALEYDQRLIPVLRETLAGATNVDLIHADAMDFDFEEVAAGSLVANLPYNVAATLVLKVLEEAPSISRLTVMTQKEVGERLAALPGSPPYGITSVLVARWGAARLAGRISRRAFFPVPNVDSVVVTVQRRDPPATGDHSTFYSVVKAAFSQRRKTLRNTLASLAGSPAVSEQRLSAAGITPDLRAEEISPQQFERLARFFE